MSKIKLYPKNIQIKDLVVIEWIDKNGEEHFPHYCHKCTDGMYQGHVTEDGLYYCPGCFAKCFKGVEKEMYENGQQYYTEWDEADFDESIYELQKAKGQKIRTYTSENEALEKGCKGSVSNQFICMLDEITQIAIRQELELIGLDAHEIEIAMDSKLCDLSDTIDVNKYIKRS